MSQPSAEELQRLREGHIIEQLILIKRFAQMKNAAVIPPLLNVVMQGKQEAIEEVAEALFVLKDVARDALRVEITHDNCFIRWSVALAIEKIGDPSYLDALIPALGLGYEPVVEVILRTLSKLAPSRFLTPNLEIILFNLTPSEKNAVAHYACRLLGSDALDVIETIYAIKILKFMRWPKLVIPLLKAAHHYDYRVRQEVQHVLEGEFDDKDIYEILTDTIEHYHHVVDFEFNLPEHENYDLNIYAIEGLGRLGSKARKSRRYLWALIRNGTLLQKIFALKALVQLQQIAPDRFMPTSDLQREINSLLRQCEGTMKLTCIQILGQLKENWAHMAIISHLDDSSPPIRLAVINALSSSKESSILEKVAILLTDRDKAIRRAVVQLFWKLDSVRFFGLNEGDIILKMPEPIRTRLFDILLDGLKNGTDEYREFACFWLSVHRYSPAFDALIENLHHPNASVVNRVIVSLGIYGDIRAIKHLIPLIYDSDQEFIARKAIESIGSLGLDGLHELIHELYRNDKMPPFLESHIMSFGGRILTYLAQEIEQEDDPKRKTKLQEFYQRVSEKYQISTPDDFKILL